MSHRTHKAEDLSLDEGFKSVCGILKPVSSAADWADVDCQNCRRVLVVKGKELYRRIGWTDSCSGCFEGGDYMGMAHHYPYDNKAGCHVGAGCRECGYTGKRKQSWLSPENHAARVALGVA